MTLDPFAEAEVILGCEPGELDGTLPPNVAAALRRRQCGCGGPIENKHGTCDECQDAAYQGDANGRW